MYDTITDVPGIQVGHYTDPVAVTGCTVVLCPEGAVGGVDVRGAAPGTRETDLLRPLNLVQQAHAVVLSGGSAYGLAAADGVMTYLEERGIGFPVGVGVVPIVASAILFDLAIGDPTVRPRPENGYQACVAADSTAPAQGSVGAGTGATVGKTLGPDRAVKGGLGCASRRVGDYVVGALVAVNALGSIVDAETGRLVAGPRDNGWPRLPGQRRSILERMRGCPGRSLGLAQHNAGRRRHRRPPQQGAGQQGRPDGPRRPRHGHTPRPHHV